MVGTSSLIFLNFIIAEVSNSYQKVRDRIDEEVQKERANLINEVETLYTEKYKKSRPDIFPKYTIIREAIV